MVIYTGQDDLNVPTSGTYNTVIRLDWSGNKNFFTAPKKIWQDDDGYVIGNYQHYQLLTYVVVNKAGHMVPMDQPWSAKRMLDMFIEGVF